MLCLHCHCRGLDPSFGRTREQCIASARLYRDDCMRAASGDNYAQRRCMDGYLNATARCRSGAVRIRPIPIAPKTRAVPRTGPPLSKPPQPKLQIPKASER
ncbi:MAG: hypothetical protein HC850_04480 [Rhodomicrobium sp.]|nr:hypothetical protein [Rhodomicrobium sp.]